MAAQSFVDFQVLKENVSIEKAVQMLGLTMKKNGDQLRSACPQCKTGGDRALAVNIAKGSFYCFALKKGGDVISLAAHIRGCSQRDGALFLAGGATPQAKTTQQPPKKVVSFNADQYLEALDPAADALKDLGVSPDTLKEWKAGYCKSGVHRGKLAIALCDQEGNMTGFCGRSLDGSSPLLTFPNGFEPQNVLFGADRVTAGVLYLARDPLHVIEAYENGITNVVAVLTDSISVTQLEALIALMRERGIEAVELH